MSLTEFKDFNESRNSPKVAWVVKGAINLAIDMFQAIIINSTFL